MRLGLLFLLFTVVPALELFLLLQIGAWLGAFETFLLVVITGTVGALLAKREGVDVFRQLAAELQNGLPPGSRLAEGLLVFVGGVLLVTPGVLTDLAGFALIFPWTRRWLAPRLVKAIASGIDVRIGGMPRPPGGPGAGGTPGGRPPHPNPFSSPFDDLP